MSFTPEELAAMKAFDDNVDRTFELTEEERRRSDAMDGKEKSRARARAYYWAHRDERKAYSRVYYLSNKERIKKYQKAYFEAHRDQYRARNLRNYHKNKANITPEQKEKKRAYQREYRKRRKERNADAAGAG